MKLRSKNNNIEKYVFKIAITSPLNRTYMMEGIKDIPTGKVSPERDQATKERRRTFNGSNNSVRGAQKPADSLYGADNPDGPGYRLRPHKRCRPAAHERCPYRSCATGRLVSSAPEDLLTAQVVSPVC